MSGPGFSRHLKTILLKKGWLLVLSLLFILVFINYSLNLKQYAGRDVLTMYDPMKMLLISQWSSLNAFMMQLYPILVVLPAGFTLFQDRHSGMRLYWLSREGASRYYLETAAAAFTATFLTFTLPLLTEVLLNILAFPWQADGDPSGSSSYLGNLGLEARNYLYFPVYYRSSFAYVVVVILMFGLISGILSVFSSVWSFVFPKYQVLLIIPVYVILFVLSNLKVILGLDVSTNYAGYINAFDPSVKSKLGFATIVLLLLSLSCLALGKKIKEDQLR
ncbi:MAG: hypothetical protein PHR21_01845 [Oscillospiraceae bacterium]|nr:hypothetical protein [Oscillospiraceae bacterium]MDD4368971.1 hypothetical protein [Oscillospiraceae bacterium]